MKTKIFFAVVLFLILSFLILTVPLVQASPIKNFWYNTLSFLGIIEITNANHLNSDRIVISDIYNEVKGLDDVWSEEIPDGDYARIRFEKNLTFQNDITIYPRVVSGNPIVEIYEKDKNELIAEFSSINSNQYNKVFLTNLKNSQDSFDLKILEGSIEFDHIIDPFWNESVASAANNPAYNGTLNDNNADPVISSTSVLAAASYTRITAKDNDPFIVPGNTSTLDTFVFVNFTIPSNYVSMIATTWSNTSTGTINIALWNFSSNAWIVVRSRTSTANANLNYTIDNATQKENFVSNNQVRVMAYDVSNSLSTLWVDYIVLNTSVDTSYPIFSNYWDDNATLTGSGTANFNVTLLNTNESVFLEINNQNLTARNITANGVYNVSASLTSGNYTYRWHSWGNDSLKLYNKSIDTVYTVNSSASTCTCPGLNQNWGINMGDYCVISTTCDLGTGSITFTGTGNATFNAAISSINLEYPTTDQILFIGSNAIITIG
ncbi:MAG: hypothetical protein AABX30_02855 [Nanoarchaeota archaeon]